MSGLYQPPGDDGDVRRPSNTLSYRQQQQQQQQQRPQQLHEQPRPQSIGGAIGGIGSFDDYDSIIDGEFSIGRRTAESDDVSSMLTFGASSLVFAAGGGDESSSPARSGPSSGTAADRRGSRGAVVASTPPRSPARGGALRGAGESGTGLSAPSPTRSVRFADDEKEAGASTAVWGPPGGGNDGDAVAVGPKTSAGSADPSDLLAAVIGVVDVPVGPSGVASPPGGGATRFVPASSALRSGPPHGQWSPVRAKAVGASWGAPSTSSSPARSAASSAAGSSSLGLASDDGAGGTGSGRYYHVGDLGIDSTDVSAILGITNSEDPTFDNDNDEEDGHSLPSAEEAKNRVAMDENGGGSIARTGGEADDGQAVGSSMRSKRKLGPLGDELSYTVDASFNHRDRSRSGLDRSHELEDIHDNQGRAYDDYDSGYGSDEEEGILPDWFASSSGRVKCVFVSSAALVFGTLVLAIVAMGISYGAVGMDDGSGGAVSLDRAQGVPSHPGSGGLPPPKAVPAPPKAVPTRRPTVSPLAWLKTKAPVLSTTGEAAGAPTIPPVPTVEPTAFPSSAMPTFAHTLTSDLSGDVLDVILDAVPPPTRSPREQHTEIHTASVDNDVATSASDNAASSNAPTAPARPSLSTRLTSPPTAIPSFDSSATPSSIPPSDVPSSWPSLSTYPTSSASPTGAPSSSPTTTIPPTSSPSAHPTYHPSAPPSISSGPSWSFGDDAPEGGDVTFYLMADGGSNWRYWMEKMENLPAEDRVFLAHLGSSTRAIDNCEATAYYRTQLSLSASPVTVYSVPGDNDFPECSDPIEGWRYYQQHMMEINTMYWNTTNDYDVKRQDERRENFSFLYRRVLFVGLNMVTNTDANETQSRLEDNINWMATNLDVYRAKIDAVFVMGYGRLLANKFAPFIEALAAWKGSDDWKDVLFMYARRASMSGLEKNVGGVKNLLELRVGNNWPIMDVRVRTGGGRAKVEYRDVVEEDVVVNVGGEEV